MLVLADDLGLALQSAAPFAGWWIQMLRLSEPDESLVNHHIKFVDLDIRRLPENEARVRIDRWVSFLADWDVRHLYKLTAPDLSGHVALELQALSRLWPVVWLPGGSLDAAASLFPRGVARICRTERELPKKVEKGTIAISVDTGHCYEVLTQLNDCVLAGPGTLLNSWSRRMGGRPAMNLCGVSQVERWTVLRPGGPADPGESDGVIAVGIDALRAAWATGTTMIAMGERFPGTFELREGRRTWMLVSREEQVEKILCHR